MGDISRQGMYAHMPIIRDIVYGAVARGACLNKMCARIGIPPLALHDSEQRLGFEASIKSWNVAVEITGDPLLGLHLGESTNPWILGLVGHLMQSSPDLNVAFQKVCEHSEVATNMFRYKLQRKGDQVMLQFQPAAYWTNVSAATAKQAVDQAMAGTLQVFYLISGKRINPAHADITHKRSSHVHEYERVFASSITFSAPVNQLVFNARQLETPVMSYDRSLFAVFEKLIREQKSRKSETTVNRLHRIILEEFKGQVPQIEILASRLNMTTRSLQRRLADEKTTFRKFSDIIKKNVAQTLLSTKNSKVSQVADMMGYADASAFRRAHKRWSDKTPRQR